MHNACTAPRRIPVFFYGSFIRPDVMASAGFVPEHIEVVRLSGFDMRVCPHACIVRSSEHSIYGILVSATHEELHRLYHRDGVGVFLPQAVVVEMPTGSLMPAMCYIPPAAQDQPADADYLERLLVAAREHGFPEWYQKRLERFRPSAQQCSA